MPERRSNHCSFIVNDYLYIHGGRDIKEGPMSNMWKLNLNGLEELAHDSTYNVAWELVKEVGAGPGRVSHHSTVSFGNNVLFFGGMTGFAGVEDVYQFDCNKERWSKLQQTGDIPKPRDDHSLAVINDNSFIIFGGFVNGSRCNECFIAKKSDNVLEWTQVGQQCAVAPCQRASHSASVFKNKMYMFGGQDDDNNKLCDLWEFDIDTQTWTQIELPDNSYKPCCRSGHSSNICHDKLYIFGGILELTKELNELIVFDFNTKCFSLVGKST